MPRCSCCRTKACCMQAIHEGPHQGSRNGKLGSRRGTISDIRWLIMRHQLPRWNVYHSGCSGFQSVGMRVLGKLESNAKWKREVLQWRNSAWSNHDKTKTKTKKTLAAKALSQRVHVLQGIPRRDTLRRSQYFITGMALPCIALCRPEVQDIHFQESKYIILGCYSSFGS